MDMKTTASKKSRWGKELRDVEFQLQTGAGDRGLLSQRASELLSRIYET